MRKLQIIAHFTCHFRSCRSHPQLSHDVRSSARIKSCFCQICAIKRLSCALRHVNKKTVTRGVHTDHEIDPTSWEHARGTILPLCFCVKHPSHCLASSTFPLCLVHRPAVARFNVSDRRILLTQMKYLPKLINRTVLMKCQKVQWSYLSRGERTGLPLLFIV